MAQYKRRLIPIVDRRFQFKYTAIIVAIAAAVSAVLGYFLLESYLTMNAVIDLASEVNDKLNKDDTRKVFGITLVFLVLEVVGLGIMGLLITHRVCGPVVVLTRDMETVLEGKHPAPRVLRQNDEFRETFEIFTAVVDGMRQRDKDEMATIAAAIAAARAKGVAEADVAPLQALVDQRAARCG